jgi:hypothetical protein
MIRHWYHVRDHHRRPQTLSLLIQHDLIVLLPAQYGCEVGEMSSKRGVVGQGQCITYVMNGPDRTP